MFTFDTGDSGTTSARALDGLSGVRLAVIERDGPAMAGRLVLRPSPPPPDLVKAMAL